MDEEVHTDIEAGKHPKTQTTTSGVTCRLVAGQVSCIFAFSSLSYAVYCIWQSSSNIDYSSLRPQLAARGIVARASLIDLSLLSFTLFVGLLVTLTHSCSSSLSSPPSASHKSSSPSSSLVVAYKLFEMIVAADITMRLLRYCHVIHQTRTVQTHSMVLLLIVPCVASVVEVSVIVAWFLDTHQQRDQPPLMPSTPAIKQPVAGHKFCPLHTSTPIILPPLKTATDNTQWRPLVAGPTTLTEAPLPAPAITKSRAANLQL